MIEQTQVPSGRFAMGAAPAAVHEVQLAAFDIDAPTATVEDFNWFVDDTGYGPKLRRSASLPCSVST